MGRRPACCSGIAPPRDPWGFRQPQGSGKRPAWPWASTARAGQRLRFAEEEASRIAALLGGEALLGPAGKRAALFQRGPDCALPAHLLPRPVRPGHAAGVVPAPGRRRDADRPGGAGQPAPALRPGDPQRLRERAEPGAPRRRADGPGAGLHGRRRAGRAGHPVAGGRTLHAAADGALLPGSGRRSQLRPGPAAAQLFLRSLSRQQALDLLGGELSGRMGQSSPSPIPSTGRRSC